MRVKLSVLFLAISVTACTVEEEKTSFLCTSAENSKINGETGFRSVFLTESYGQTIIGYSQNNGMIKHSECSAASVVYNNDDNSNLYSWFEFGTNTPNDDGLLSIKFYNYQGKTISVAERKQVTGIPTFEFVEQDIGGGSPIITKRKWEKEPQLDLIVSSDNFEGDADRYSTAQSGKLIKKKEYNFNTQVWNCSYDNDGSVSQDVGCINESTLDIHFFGFPVDLSSYSNLKHTINYDLDEDNLIDDINNYYR